MEENKKTKIELEYLFRKKGFKNKDIAKFLDLEVQAFSRKLNGYTKFNQNEKSKLLKVIPELKNYPNILIRL